MIQFFLALIFTWNTLAADPCITDLEDPFDPGKHALVTKGRYKGKCQDSAHKRTALPLSSEQAASFFKAADINPREGVIAVSNVSHGDQFWVALIPVDAIERVYVQMERFPPKWIAAHTQIRMQFQKDRLVTLVPQSKKNMNPITKISDIVLSSEFNAPVGVAYDLIKGLDTYNPFFSINHRMLSLQEKVNKVVIEEKHQVEQFPLNLSATETQTLLKKWLVRSAKENMTSMYSTLTCSCTTELYRVLDDSVDYAKRGISKPKVGRIPVLSERDLRSRKLLLAGKRYPDLDVELGIPINAPRCDQKLRDYENYGSE